MTTEHTPGSLVTTLDMMRSYFSGSILVLEGEDDRRFWQRRIDKASCQCALAGAKNTLLLAVQRLDETGFRGALGVIDADLDHLESRLPSSPNILATDTVDLEAMLIRSTAFDGVLAEIGDPAKIESFERRSGHTVRTALLERSLSYGRLRWVSDRAKLKIPVEKLSPYKYMNEETWSLDHEGLLRDAGAHTNSLSPDDLRSLIESLPAHDPWSVVHGKDMVRILDVGLKRQLGNGSHTDHVARLLRQGIDSAELHQTRLGVGITSWEQRNPPYVVLARPAA
ncbi:MAG: DUF4435 domain-containing protein [Polyangiaceae bacterium]